jgi:hypothetical protein
VLQALVAFGPQYRAVGNLATDQPQWRAIPVRTGVRTPATVGPRAPRNHTHGTDAGEFLLQNPWNGKAVVALKLWHLDTANMSSVFGHPAGTAPRHSALWYWSRRGLYRIQPRAWVIKAAGAIVLGLLCAGLADRIAGIVSVTARSIPAATDDTAARTIVSAARDAPQRTATLATETDGPAPDSVQASPEGQGADNLQQRAAAPRLGAGKSEPRHVARRDHDNTGYGSRNVQWRFARQWSPPTPSP